MGRLHLFNGCSLDAMTKVDYFVPMKAAMKLSLVGLSLCEGGEIGRHARLRI